MEKSTICIYHEHCNDGTTAAAVFLRKFPTALTFPLSHGYDAEDIAPILEHIHKDSVVYTIDCALGIKEVLAQGAQVITLDHHAGMKDEMDQLVRQEPNLTYVFDNEKSGATVAWAYFFPNEEVPTIARLVEDADIWKWKLKPESSWLNSIAYVFQNKPEEVLHFFNDDALTELLKKAKIVSEFTDWYTDEIVEDNEPIFIKYKNYKIPAYNTTFLMRSAIANRLLDPELGVCIAFRMKGPFVHMSVRSQNGSILSALEVAQSMGGNGHRNAAGVPPIPLQKFMDLIA